MYKAISYYFVLSGSDGSGGSEDELIMRETDRLRGAR
jgi:hypothetical protein